MALYARVLVICLKSNLPRLLRVRFQNRDAPVRYPYRIAGLARYIAAAFITICFLVTGTAQAGAAREVLVLHSYNLNSNWTKSVMDGIESTLKQYKGRIELDIEYMDTRRITDEKHYENLYALYKHKAGYKQYEIVIVVNNNALDFLLRHRDELYPNVPLVFCGIANFHESMLQGHELVTGAILKRMLEPTVEIALELHPSARRVVFVNHIRSKVKAVRWKGLIEEVSRRFSRRAEFVSSWLSEPTVEELLKAIDGLGDESIVIFTGLFKDPAGNRYVFREATDIIQQHCAAPIYILTKEWFGYGPVVGGKNNSGFHQGQAAAQIVLRILNGESAQDIPIVRDGLDKYIFDYVQMKRFGISLSDVPEGSIVINEPESFYYLYKRRIWTVITIVAGLAAVVIILSVNILRRKKAEEALQASEQNFKSLTEITTDWIWEVDEDGVYTYASPKVKEFLGYEVSEVVGKTPFDFMPEGEAEKIGKFFKEKAIKKEPFYRLENVNRHKDGHLVVLETNGTPILDEEGQLKGYRGIDRDITERKKAEEALRESEGKFGAMLESIGDHMSMLDKDLNIIWANKTAQKIFGDNIIGKKCYEVYHKRKEPCEPHPCPALKAFQDGKIHEHDTQVIDKNGERIYFHCSTNVALRDKEGTPTAVIEICKDITERKQVAEALRERTLELGKRVKEQNCLYDMAEILDTPEILLDDILQKTAAIIPPAFQYPEITSVRVILKGQEFRTENFRETSSKQSSDIVVSGEQIGSVEVCYLEKKPQMDKGPFLKEEISLLDAIAERLRRVIERREAEEKVLHYQAQLKSLASELSLTEERERHRIATELHDRISQSIVISKVKLEELRESTSSADLAKSIGEICNWLDETIQNTRLLTSDLSSPILYELGFEAAVSEWLAEQVQEKHGITTEFEDDGQAKPLDDDIRALLFHMVQELLINVVKHAQAHKVKVFSRKVNSEVHVSVEDDGVGFNPTETASMPTKTGGFGLFSIRERLEQLGGRLEIKSEPAHGCRVTVMVPLKQGKINDEGQE